MPNSLTFVVYGLPAPQGSKRSLGNGILVESSKAVRPWRTDVKHAALACIPPGWDTTLPMSLSIVFRFKRPQGTSARAGDIDKLQRSTLDSLTGVAFDDDRQVVSVNASKRYCVGDEPQGALITVTPLT
jgi:crossover junction endodeoxyribonuclease RusA